MVKLDLDVDYTRKVSIPIPSRYPHDFQQGRRHSPLHFAPKKLRIDTSRDLWGQFNLLEDSHGNEHNHKEPFNG